MKNVLYSMCQIKKVQRSSDQRGRMKLDHSYLTFQFMILSSRPRNPIVFWAAHIEHEDFYEKS